MFSIIFALIKLNELCIDFFFFYQPGALLRRSSLDPETRRLSLGTISNSRKNSDGLLDPTHAAMLFRDSRGVCIQAPLLNT